MHLVYRIEFSKRKSDNVLPYLYIGSKSYATFDGKNILDKNGDPYRGSSSYKNYHKIYTEDIPVITILGEFHDYDECLNFEKEMHIKLNVCSDKKYFNKSLATISVYANPNYGTYRDKNDLDMFIRLPKDHPMVLSGEYVNNNKDYKTYNNGILEKQFHKSIIPSEEWILGRLPSSIRYGKDNPFYGKKHTKESIEKMSEATRNTFASDPEKYKIIRENSAKRASAIFKGVPKSAESNLKRSRPGMVMLKNKETSEVVRIRTEDKIKYDRTIWVNPSTLYPASGIDTKWITDGINSKKLKNGEILPIGYRYGRIIKKKGNKCD